MLRPIATLSIVALLAGCGGMRESRLNPWNWFGSSQEVEKVELPPAAVDHRGLIQQVLEVTVEQVPSGALVRAKGLPPSQGYWNAELKAQPVDENGLLVLEFRVFPPLQAKPSGGAISREITVVTHLSNVKLRDVREIIIQGESNARAVRR